MRSSFHWLLIFLHSVAYKPLTLFNIPKQPQGRAQQEVDAAEEVVSSSDEQIEDPQFPILSHLCFFFKAATLLQHFHLDSPRTPTKDE